ncbi:MAG: hypothetical protein U0003_00605 [Vampirovibrionales bacterium]
MFAFGQHLSPTTQVLWSPWDQPLNEESPQWVIQSTSIGVSELPQSQPFQWLWQSLPSQCFLMDLVYNLHGPTPFLEAADREEKGYVGQDGLAMLVHQAADALQLWTHQSVALVHREVLCQALRQEEI